ncbi:MAG: sulfatase/phosphatase domain-containing protein, partial [Draconibacterium sp.]
DNSFSTSNLPLRAGKGWLYEGGIRVPMIVKWPQKGNAGTESNMPVISTDFYPTILDILGLSFGKHVPDGISLAPLLKKQDTAQKKISDRPIFWHFPHYSNHGMQSPSGAVRCGDYKLIEYFENNTVQLFNLSSDPGEQVDLSQIQMEKTKELRKILHQWRKEINAQMMRPNPEYIPAKSKMTTKTTKK